MDTMQTSIPPKRRQTTGPEAKRAGSDLLSGPPIVGYQIQRNEENHVIVINHLMVRCTPDEYHLLLRLMEWYERPVSFDELIAQFHDGSHADQALLKTARRKLTCTLSDLRTKLWATDFTIVRVVDVGYLLTHRDKLWSITHPSTSKTDQRF